MRTKIDSFEARLSFHSLLTYFLVFKIEYLCASFTS